MKVYFDVESPLKIDHLHGGDETNRDKDSLKTLWDFINE